MVEETIDKYFPWGYFDGSALGDPRTCGAGGLIYFSDEHFVKFKDGLGFGTNNFAELIGLKMLVILDLHITKLQVFGDSQMIKNWVTCLHRIHNVQLSPLLNEVIRYSKILEFVEFKQIYREIHALVDDLAKAGTILLKSL